MATYEERTDKIVSILTDAATDLSANLESEVAVYKGIGRPVPEVFSLFVSRWSESGLALMTFRAGSTQDGTDNYRLICQVKCLGGEAAQNAQTMLDRMAENLNAVLQPHAAESGFWHNAQVRSSQADVRPNVSAPYTTVESGHWWQTETWLFQVQWRVTR